MKTRITTGSALLLTLGTAVAGTLAYNNPTKQDSQIAPVLAACHEERSNTLMFWRVSAATDYVAPKVPI